ncbi:hypothetical protein PGTUg99_028127 [Puccinia graminis f. sp. tritici]|uniref:Uncharacterized protein n=1 Tax=Puccinia graminis f. sp. tritici TaxID=56615 RepID=A0A5B0RUW9_PUCGR|nr:hypothetical protein PGTUg99_028127 [Puccinia graminis f. sp. tritici]
MTSNGIKSRHLPTSSKFSSATHSSSRQVSPLQHTPTITLADYIYSVIFHQQHRLSRILDSCALPSRHHQHHRLPRVIDSLPFHLDIVELIINRIT